MRKIFYTSLIVIATAIVIISCSDDKIEKQVQCFCDSTEVENNGKIMNCYYSDKLLAVEKSLNGDTTEIKKYYWSEENKYQKYEYVMLINGKTDFDKSSFIDVNIVNDKAEIIVQSKYIAQYMELLLDKDTVRSNTNKITIELSRLKNIQGINSYADKIINNDSITRVTYMSKFYITYDEIAEQKTILNRYKNLIDCGALK